MKGPPQGSPRKTQATSVNALWGKAGHQHAPPAGASQQELLLTTRPIWAQLARVGAKANQDTSFCLRRDEDPSRGFRRAEPCRSGSPRLASGRLLAVSSVTTCL